jgi:hypothetical protein
MDTVGTISAVLGMLRMPGMAILTVRGHFQEWTDAILNKGKTFAPFEIGGHLTEIGLSGIVALKLQRNIDWDGQAMKARGIPEAGALVRKQNRTKWL